MSTLSFHSRASSTQGPLFFLSAWKQHSPKSHHCFLFSLSSLFFTFIFLFFYPPRLQFPPSSDIWSGKRCSLAKATTASAILRILGSGNVSHHGYILVVYVRRTWRCLVYAQVKTSRRLTFSPTLLGSTLRLPVNEIGVTAPTKSQPEVCLITLHITRTVQK